MDLDEWMYEDWISSTIEDWQNEVEIELVNQDQEMHIEMEEEEKEHQYLLWLEATVNEFQKPVLDAAKERMFVLGIPPNFPFFRFSPLNPFESFTLARLAYQSFPWQLRMEIRNLQRIIDDGCLFYCLYLDAP
ncbi:hypothetical protein DAPPUDRAFT_117230 [Daphnia pulex]|uniref:Uncharacterized protein n=1 Tax=Daphnia pulex TaxID=6669 RepID=E9HRZ0_DAPPU|nr:hypothetical protein DAPPUDRAFT_117230 [Daphnia pulex]|eukprot:EFX65463.1 hypothetical protein DAPPUDRAFT_117230 [Daphnia pulex]